MRVEVFIAAGVSLLAYKIRAIEPRQTANQGLSPNDVLAALDNIGKISGETRDIFQQVKDSRNTQLVPRTLNNLQAFTTGALSTSLRIQKADHPEFLEDDQDAICGTFSSFLAVHQALQQSIIDAKGALATSPFTAPLASIARIIQITIDNLVFSVNGLVPACAWEFQAAQASLEKTLDQVVQTYQLSQTKKK